MHELPVELWNVDRKFGRTGKFINHPENLPTIPLNADYDNTTDKQAISKKRKKKKPFTHKKPPLFSITSIGTSAEKKMIHHIMSPSICPVLKAYPTQHSWIITAHISLDDLKRQLCMCNHQLTLVHQLLVKLQG